MDMSNLSRPPSDGEQYSDQEHEQIADVDGDALEDDDPSDSPKDQLSRDPLDHDHDHDELDSPPHPSENQDDDDFKVSLHSLYFCPFLFFFFIKNKKKTLLSTD